MPTVMPPEMAISAPLRPTPAYTTELTNRVLGFTRDEKKIARRDAFCSRPLISSNCSTEAFSWPKACTTLILPTVSSIRPVCSPRVTDWSLNMEYVRVAMKFATSSDSGVMHTTTRAMPQ